MRMLRHITAIAIVALLLPLFGGVTAVDAAAAPAAAAACAPGERYFDVTDKCVPAVFAAYWDSNGGLAQQGWPISPAFNEVNPTNGKTYLTQYFERARFEHHPEHAGTQYAVLLGLLGREQLQAKYGGNVPPGVPDNPLGTTCAAFDQTGKRVCGAFLTYWQGHGGLAQQGLPLTDLFIETNPTDGKPYPTQYFERARFEYHAEHAGTAYAVLLGLLGREQLFARYPNGAPAPPSPAPTPRANRSLVVGPGFSDVSPRQLVRTAAGVLYAVVPTCDAYPACPGAALRVYKADQPGTPAAFAEVDAAHRPQGAGTSAVALDGAGRIHALWLDRAGRAVYAAFDTAAGRWGPQEVLGATGWADFGQGDQGAALAVDAAGVPHAAWSARGPDGKLQLRYAARPAAGWEAPARADDAPLGEHRQAWHPALAFAPDGALVLAWLEGSFNYAPDGVVRVRERAAGGAWGPSLALPDAAMTGIDNGPSLLVAADGVRHLAFADTGNAARHWYAPPGQGWRGDRQSPHQVTHNPSLGPDGAGGLYLYGHGTPQPGIDGHGDNLYRARLPAGAAAWGPWALYAAGAFDSSVSPRWAQFFHHFPDRLDLLYWADPYPNLLYLGTE